MKKKIVMLMMVAVCSTMLMTGCGSKDKDDESAEATEVATEVATEIYIAEEEPVYEEPTYEEPVETYDFSVEEQVEEEPVVEVDEYGVTTIDEVKLYATEAVRIRREPNTESDVAGKLAAGDEVTANGRSEEWHRIIRNGETLYVKSEYLTETKPETTDTTSETDNAEQTAELQTTEAQSENSTTTEATATTDTTATTDAEALAAQVAAAQQAAAAAAASTASSDTLSTASTETASSTTETTTADTSAADAAAAAQAAAAAAATTAAASYDLNGLKVNATEYKALLDTWRYATAGGTDEEAREIVLHHTAADLDAVLKAKGLR